MLNILTTKKNIPKKTRQRKNCKERDIDGHPINYEHVWGNNNHVSMED